LVTGTHIYPEIVERYKVPIVISGFEPTDMLQAILELIRQANAGEHQVRNLYSRAVMPEGNLKAQGLSEKFFKVRERFEWRGLGELPQSALQIREDYSPFDAERCFENIERKAKPYKACECPAVLTGRKSPLDCPLFNNPCTPENPLGSCMVSSEGACSAYYQYHSLSQQCPPERHQQ
jgi:hydrogenase expression/formation protein HypD